MYYIFAGIYVIFMLTLGHEPEKTNEFLQLLATAINSKVLIGHEI